MKKCMGGESGNVTISVVTVVVVIVVVVVVVGILVVVGGGGVIMILCISEKFVELSTTSGFVSFLRTTLLHAVSSVDLLT
jgi:hypothetical protein